MKRDEVTDYIKAVEKADEGKGEGTTLTVTILDPPNLEDRLGSTAAADEDPFSGTGFCSADGVCH
jgi:hypothetical protein